MTGRAGWSLLAFAALALAACGGDGDGDTSAPADTVGATVPSAASTAPADEPSSTPSSVSVAMGSAPASVPATELDVGLDPDAPDLGRVVALAEEFVLADLLVLGIEPVASTATVDAVGFQGLDEFDTSEIEVLPQTTLSLEYLASLRPDTIVTLQFWVDQVGPGVLDGIAEVVVLPDGLSAIGQIEALGDLLGRPERAAQAAADVVAARDAASARVGEGCSLSVAAVYPGPSVAAFVEPIWAIPAAFDDVGCRLVPGPDVAEPDGNGRAFLSQEQLGLLAAQPLVLLQNESVEGETSALDEITSSAIWQTLPAVAADEVVVFDRLGYPGATGLVRLYGEIAALFGG